MNKRNSLIKYYLTALLMIIILPAIIVTLYEQLAGGILNGIAGSWRQAVVHPGIFLLFVNPVLLLSGYALLIYFFRQVKGIKSSTVSNLFVWLTFVVATIVVLLGVFWKGLTT